MQAKRAQEVKGERNYSRQVLTFIETSHKLAVHTIYSVMTLSVQASERRASSKLQSTLSNDSDSESEDNAAKQAKKIPKLKKKTQSNLEENQVKTWRDEFDDGLDSDLVGDEDDRDNLNDMTEKQREEELFKRAERREELKKRFEISQKLKLQQKNKERSDEQSMNSDSEDAERENFSNSGQQASSDYQGRRKGYEEKHAKKFSALNNLKAMREEKERKEFQRKEKEKKFKRKHGGSGSGSGSDLEKIGGSNKNKKMLKASGDYFCHLFMYVGICWVSKIHNLTSFFF